MRTYKIRCPNCRALVPVYLVGSYAAIDTAAAAREGNASSGAVCPKCDEPMRRPAKRPEEL